MKTVQDSNGKIYQVSDSGTCYDLETSQEVINILESLYDHRETRIRVWYGENGKSWDEENDVTGYLGRSTGMIKVPLLINNKKSYGGVALLDAYIVKIVNTRTKRTLYQHPKFTQGKFAVTDSDLKEYQANVNREGEIYARCKSLANAQRLADFMNGLRFAK